MFYLVVSKKDGLHKAAKNVPGVDVVSAKDLCAEDLAPGGDLGRLTVWTRSAIEASGVILMVDPYSIILMPWITEKTLEARRVADFDGKYRENNNRIEFIVRREATKPQIRAAIEKLLDVKVDKVNTKITRSGKHASIRLAEGYDAEEAALKLGAF